MLLEIQKEDRKPPSCFNFNPNLLEVEDFVELVMI
jgi:hypothetical protein